MTDIGQEPVLFEGDCLEWMKQIPDKSVDIVVCDLPYGVTACSWDVPLPLDLLWKEWNRVCKETAPFILFCQMPFTLDLAASNRKNFRYILTWYKHNARGFLNAKRRPLSVTEEIAVFYRQQCTYNPEMRKGPMREKGFGGRQSDCYRKIKETQSKNDQYYPVNILDFPGVSNTKRCHPTEKPVPLLEYLIRTYSNEGDVVLDNCMGSGSTGVAALNAGRKFVGIEKDPAYYQTAERRIRGAIDDQNVQL